MMWIALHSQSHIDMLCDRMASADLGSYWRLDWDARESLWLCRRIYWGSGGFVSVRQRKGER